MIDVDSNITVEACKEGGRRVACEACKSFYRGHEFFGKDPYFGMFPPFMAWNILIIVAVALIIYWLIKTSKSKPDDAIIILKKRYASGEIDKKTFEGMKKDLVD